MPQTTPPDHSLLPMGLLAWLARWGNRMEQPRFHQAEPWDRLANSQRRQLQQSLALQALLCWIVLLKMATAHLYKRQIPQTCLLDRRFRQLDRSPKLACLSLMRGTATCMYHQAQRGLVSDHQHSLINFTVIPTSARLAKRQSTFSVPAQYNLSQQVAVQGDTPYVLSTYAEFTPEDGSNSQCTIQPCADGLCGAVSNLGSTYSQFTLPFTSSADESTATITLSFVCSAPAYVGVDNVAISPDAPGTTPITTTVFQTKTVQQNSTITETSITTTTVTTDAGLVPNNTLSGFLTDIATETQYITLNASCECSPFHNRRIRRSRLSRQSKKQYLMCRMHC